MKLRFTSRDLLYLVLLVAVNIGWSVYAGLVGSQAVIMRAEARRWKATAGALENALKLDGWEIEQSVGNLHLRPAAPTRLPRSGNHTFAVQY